MIVKLSIAGMWHIADLVNYVNESGGGTIVTRCGKKKALGRVMIGKQERYARFCRVCRRSRGRKGGS